MTEATSVPFTPTIVRGFVTDIREFEDVVQVKLSGLEAWFWVKRDDQGNRIRVFDELTLEMDGAHIIGILLRLV